MVCHRCKLMVRHSGPIDGPATELRSSSEQLGFMNNDIRYDDARLDAACIDRERIIISHADRRSIYDQFETSGIGGARPDRVASRCARLELRDVSLSYTTSSEMPLSASAKAIAVPTPPVPTSSVRLPFGFAPLVFSFSTKPIPSVISPRHLPSPSAVMKLTDRTISARSVRESTSRRWPAYVGS
jgi:hypothetical protein